MITLLLGLIIGYIAHKEFLSWKNKLPFKTDSRDGKGDLKSGCDVFDQMLYFLVSPILIIRKNLYKSEWAIGYLVIFLSSSIMSFIVMLAEGYVLQFIIVFTVTYFMPLWIPRLFSFLSAIFKRLDKLAEKIEAKNNKEV